MSQTFYPVTSSQNPVNHIWLGSVWENTLFWELILMLNHPLGWKCATSFNSAPFLLPASGSCHAHFHYIKEPFDIPFWGLGVGFFWSFVNFSDKPDKIPLGGLLCLWAGHLCRTCAPLPPSWYFTCTGVAWYQYSAGVHTHPTPWGLHFFCTPT